VRQRRSTKFVTHIIIITEVNRNIAIEKSGEKERERCLELRDWGYRKTLLSTPQDMEEIYKIGSQDVGDMILRKVG
jgi:hypothetical protein